MVGPVAEGRLREVVAVPVGVRDGDMVWVRVGV